MKVSVIIPTYNRSKLVVETLRTVLDQTYRDKEVIIVDDGSTDDTESALSPYLDRITYIRQENQGVNAARNTALEVAKGEYIALLDSDDLWMDFKLDLEVAVLDDNPDVGFVYGDFVVSRDNDSDMHNGLRAWYTVENDWEKLFYSSTSLPEKFAESHPELQPENYKLYFGDIYHSSLHHPAVLPSASLYRRSKSPKGRAFNEDDSTCGDWEFFARLSRAHGAAFIELETTYNRSHEDAVRLTRLDAAIQLRRQIKLIDRIWRADPEFMETHLPEVDNRQYQLYCELIRAQLVGGDSSGARQSLKEFQGSGIVSPDRRLWILRFIAYFPCAATAIRLLRRLKHILGGTTDYLKWKRAQFLERRFDLKHDIETSIVESKYLQAIDSSSVEFAIPYEPIQHDVFSRMMASLVTIAPEYSDYPFLDLGSGKGRALLYAAEWNFTRCIGVEFSPELHALAEQNIAAYKLNGGDSAIFELHCIDARHFDLPRENLVLFLYNPFTGGVMQEVVKKIEQLVRSTHCDIWVLYRNPTCSNLFSSDVFSRHVSNPSYEIYRARAANPA